MASRFRNIAEQEIQDYLQSKAPATSGAPAAPAIDVAKAQTLARSTSNPRAQQAGRDMLAEDERQQYAAAKQAEADQKRAEIEAKRVATEQSKAAEDLRKRNVRAGAAAGMKVETDVESGKRSIATTPTGETVWETGPVGDPRVVKTTASPFYDPKAKRQANEIPDAIVQDYRNAAGDMKTAPLPTKTDPKTGAITAERKDEFGAPVTQALGTDQDVKRKADALARIEAESAAAALRANAVDQTRLRFQPQFEPVKKEFDEASKELARVKEARSREWRRNAKGEWEKFDPNTDIAIPNFNKVERAAEITVLDKRELEAKERFARAKAKHDPMAGTAANLDRNDTEVKAQTLRLRAEKIRIEQDLPDNDGGLAEIMASAETGIPSAGQQALEEAAAPQYPQVYAPEVLDAQAAKDASTSQKGTPVEAPKPLLETVSDPESALKAFSGLQGIEGLTLSPPNATFTGINNAAGKWIGSIEDAGNGMKAIVLNDSAHEDAGISKTVALGVTGGAPVYFRDSGKPKDATKEAAWVGSVIQGMKLAPDAQMANNQVRMLGATREDIKEKVNAGEISIQSGEALMQNLYGDTLKPTDPSDPANFQKWLANTTKEENAAHMALYGTPARETTGVRWAKANAKTNKAANLLTGGIAGTGAGTYSLADQNEVRRDFLADSYLQNHGKPGVTRAAMLKLHGQDAADSASVLERLESMQTAAGGMVKYDALGSIAGMALGAIKDASAAEVAMIAKVAEMAGIDSTKTKEEAQAMFMESIGLRNRSWSNFTLGVERTSKAWLTQDGREKSLAFDIAFKNFQGAIDEEYDKAKPEAANVAAAEQAMRKAAMAMHGLAPDESWPITEDSLDPNQDAALGGALARYMATADPRQMALYKSRLLMSNGRRQLSSAIEKKTAGRGKLGQAVVGGMYVGWQELGTELLADGLVLATGFGSKVAQGALKAVGAVNKAGKIERMGTRLAQGLEKFNQIGIRPESLVNPLTRGQKVTNTLARGAHTVAIMGPGEAVEEMIVEVGEDDPQMGRAALGGFVGSIGLAPILHFASKAVAGIPEREAQAKRDAANVKWTANYNASMADVKGFQAITPEQAMIARSFVDPEEFAGIVGRVAEARKTIDGISEAMVPGSTPEEIEALKGQAHASLDQSITELAAQTEGGIAAVNAIAAVEDPAKQAFYSGLAKVATGNTAALTQSERSAIAGGKTQAGAPLFVTVAQPDGSVREVVTDEARAELMLDMPAVGQLIQTTESQALVTAAIDAAQPTPTNVTDPQGQPGAQTPAQDPQSAPADQNAPGGPVQPGAGGQAGGVAANGTGAAPAAPVSGNAAAMDAAEYSALRAQDPSLPDIPAVVAAARAAGQPVSASMAKKAGTPQPGGQPVSGSGQPVSNPAMVPAAKVAAEVKARVEKALPSLKGRIEITDQDAATGGAELVIETGGISLSIPAIQRAITRAKGDVAAVTESLENIVARHEAVHIVQVEAVRAQWKAEGSPGSFDAYFDQWYGKLAKDLLTPETEEAAAAIYGGIKPKDWRKMTAEQRATTAWGRIPNDGRKAAEFVRMLVEAKLDPAKSDQFSELFRAVKTQGAKSALAKLIRAAIDILKGMKLTGPAADHVAKIEELYKELTAATPSEASETPKVDTGTPAPTSGLVITPMPDGSARIMNGTDVVDEVKSEEAEATLARIQEQMVGAVPVTARAIKAALEKFPRLAGKLRQQLEDAADEVTDDIEVLPPGERVAAAEAAIAERIDRIADAEAQRTGKNRMEVIEGFRAVAGKRASQQAASIEAAVIGTEKPQIPAGKQEQRDTPNGEMTIDVVSTAVDLDQLVGSSDPLFPGAALQPRNRSTQASQNQREEMVNNLRDKPDQHRRYIEGSTTDSGRMVVAPLFAADGTHMTNEAGKPLFYVISGNGRRNALKEAVARNVDGPVIRKFRQTLINDEGINTGSMLRPVPVSIFVPTSAKEAIDLAEFSNRDAQLSVSNTEQATRDAASIEKANILKLWEPDAAGNASSASNRPFVKAFARAIGDESLIDGRGELTDEGAQRIERAMVAMLLGPKEAALLDQLFNRAGVLGLRGVLGGVASETGALLKLAATKPDFDLSQVLAQALALAVEAKQAVAAEDVADVAEFFDQGQLFDSTENTPERQLARAIVESRSRKAVREILAAYKRAADAVDTSTASMFAESDTTREELILKALEARPIEQVIGEIEAEFGKGSDLAVKLRLGMPAVKRLDANTRRDFMAGIGAEVERLREGVLSAEEWQRLNPDALGPKEALFQRFLDSHTAQTIQEGFNRLLSPKVQAVLRSSPTPERRQFVALYVPPGPAMQKIKALMDSIPAEEKARGNPPPHVTLGYGLESPVEEVREALGGIGTMQLTLEPLQMLGNHLVAPIRMTPQLQAARAAIDPLLDNPLPFFPHLTIAVMKPGEGARHIGSSTVDGLVVDFTHASLTEGRSQRMVELDRIEDGIEFDETDDIFLPARSMEVSEGGPIGAADNQLKAIEQLAGRVSINTDSSGEMVMLVNPQGTRAEAVDRIKQAIEQAGGSVTVEFEGSLDPVAVGDFMAIDGKLPQAAVDTIKQMTGRQAVLIRITAPHQMLEALRQAKAIGIARPPKAAEAFTLPPKVTVNHPESQVQHERIWGILRRLGLDIKPTGSAVSGAVVPNAQDDLDYQVLADDLGTVVDALVAEGFFEEPGGGNKFLDFPTKIRYRKLEIGWDKDGVFDSTQQKTRGMAAWGKADIAVVQRGIWGRRVTPHALGRFMPDSWKKSLIQAKSAFKKRMAKYKLTDEQKYQQAKDESSAYKRQRGWELESFWGTSELKEVRDRKVLSGIAKRGERATLEQALRNPRRINFFLKWARENNPKDEYGVPTHPLTLRDNETLLEETRNLPTVKIQADPELIPLLEGGYLREGEMKRADFIEGVARYLADQAEQASGRSDNPTVVFTAGGFGAGKTFSLDHLRNSKQSAIPLPPEESEVGADITKEFIPEYITLKRAGDGRAGDVAQYESNEIAYRVMALLIERKVSFIYDSSGGLASTRERNAKAKAAGFSTVIVGVSADPIDAWQRAGKRGWETGRFITKRDYFFSSHERFANEFEELAKVGDAFWLLETGSSMANPRVIGNRKQGAKSIAIRDKAGYDLAREWRTRQVWPETLRLSQDRARRVRVRNDGGNRENESGAQDSALSPQSRDAGGNLTSETAPESTPRQAPGGNVTLGSSPAPLFDLFGAIESQILGPRAKTKRNMVAAAQAQPAGGKAQTNIAKDIAKREGLADLDLFAGAAVKSLAKKPKRVESAPDEYDLFSGNGGAGNRGAFGNPTPQPGGSGTIRGMAGNPDLFDLGGGNAATGLAGGERSGGSSGGRGVSGDSTAGDSERGATGEPDSTSPRGNRRGRNDGTAGSDAGLIDIGESSIPDAIAVPENEADRNARINPGETLVPKGQGAKIAANFKVIELLRSLTAEARNPTEAEKAQLLTYSGWGHSKGGFDDAKAKAFEDRREDYLDRMWENDKARFKREQNYHRTNSKGEEEPSPFDLYSWNEKWGDVHRDLREKLSDKEYNAAKRSVLNAHYTTPAIIDAQWQMVEKLGFKGGRALEPGGGIGHYIGTQPQHLAERTIWSAVELDQVTAQILALLYPQARVNSVSPAPGREVTGQGFEEALIADNSQDIVISNVPFHEVGPWQGMKQFKTELNLHNYFFARALQKVKPGGFVVFITSSSTMENNAAQRRFLASRGELISAVRLPNNAFKENAGTEVTTDIIILRKPDGRKVESHAWLGTRVVGSDTVNLKRGDQTPIQYLKSFDTEGSWQDETLESARKAWDDLRVEGLKIPASNAFKAEQKANSEATAAAWKSYVAAFERAEADAIGMKLGATLPIRVNEYFAANPQNVFGTHALAGSMYSPNEYALLPDEAAGTLEQRFAKVIEALPSDIMGQASTVKLGTVRDIERTDVPNSFVERDGQFWQVQKNHLEPVEWSNGEKVIFRSWNRVKTSVRNLISAELDPKAEIEEINELRETLNREYGKHVGQFGAISKTGQGQKHGHLSTDPDFPLTVALENPVKFTNRKGKSDTRYDKADIFRVRMNKPLAPPVKAESVSDALLASLVWMGYPHPGYMAKLLGRNEAAVKQEAIESELVFDDPTSGNLVIRDSYLSGHVQGKLDEARAAAEDDPAYRRNVAALEAALPERKGIAQIGVAMNSPWLPPAVLTGFLEHLGVAEAKVTYNSASNSWSVFGVGNADQFSTADATTVELVQHALEMVPPRISNPEGRGKDRKLVFDPGATQLAKSTMDALKLEFVRWAKTSDASVDGVNVQDMIVDAFNEKANGHRPPQHSGEHITLPGASDEVFRSKIRRSAIARMIDQGSGMIAHGVGFGKTYTLIALAMELKRLGKANRPMIIVENATLGQFAASFRTAYPNARLLVADKASFEGKKRRQFIARIATGDHDCIVMPHSSFNLIGNHKDVVNNYINEQVAELEAARALTDSSDQRAVAALEKAKINLENSRKKLLDALASRQDIGMTWEDLGIDTLLVDESHRYKNAPVITRMQGMKNLPTGAPSQRAIGMVLKTRGIQDKMGGRGVFFATGTPVSNSMAEAYIMLRYTDPGLLRQAGIENFDQFVASFGESETKAEANWKGAVSMETRLSKFVNGNALINLIRSSWDVQMDPDLAGINRPDIRGGASEQVMVTPGPANEAYNDWVINTIAAQWQDPEFWTSNYGSKKDAFEDHPWLSAIPIMTMQAGIAAALDIRLIDPNAPDFENSKVNTAVRSIVETYKATSSYSGAQAVFADLRESFSVDHLLAFAGDPGLSEKGLEIPEIEDIAVDADGNPLEDQPAKPKKPKKAKEFDLYQDIKAKLVAQKIPASEIALISSAMSPDKRTELFDKVNSGEIRVVIGSTDLMGVGVNMQERLVALHHLMPPRDFKPASMEQRNGRILRQGNIHYDMQVEAFVLAAENATGQKFRKDKGGRQVPDLKAARAALGDNSEAMKLADEAAANHHIILREYAMEKSIDSAIYSMMAAKQRMVVQLLMGEVSDFFEDPSDAISMGMAEIAARAIGDPTLIRRVELEREIRNLTMEYSGFEADVASARSSLRYAEGAVRSGAEKLTAAKRFAESVGKIGTDTERETVWEFGGQTVDRNKPKDAEKGWKAPKLIEALDLYLAEESAKLANSDRKKADVPLVVDGVKFNVEIHQRLGDTRTETQKYEDQMAGTDSSKSATGMIKWKDSGSQWNATENFKGAQSLIASINGMAKRARNAPASAQADVDYNQKQIPSLQFRASREFGKQEELDALRGEMAVVERRLAENAAPPRPPAETPVTKARKKGIELPPVSPVDPKFMTPEVKDIIERSTIEDSALTLPEELDRKVYERVNKALESAGGRWDRSTKTHLFAEDPSVALGLAPAPSVESAQLVESLLRAETPENYPGRGLAPQATLGSSPMIDSRLLDKAKTDAEQWMKENDPARLRKMEANGFAFPHGTFLMDIPLDALKQGNVVTQSYVDAVAREKVVAPIDVDVTADYTGGKTVEFIVADGNHRVAGARQRGDTTIKAFVTPWDDKAMAALRGSFTLASSPSPESEAVQQALDKMPPLYRKVFEAINAGDSPSVVMARYKITERAVSNILDQTRARIATATAAAGDSLTPVMRGDQMLGGRPDLALSTNPAVAAVDQLRNESDIPDVRGWEEVNKQASAMLAGDYQGTYDMLLGKARDIQPMTDVEVAAAKMIIARETLGGKISTPEERIKLGMMIYGYREIGTETARSLAIRRDPTMRPAERHAQFIAEALFTPDADTRRRMKTNPKAAETILAGWMKRIDAIKAELLAQGIDIDAALADFNASQEARKQTEAESPRAKAVIEDTIRKLNRREKAVIEAIRSGALVTKAALITGMSVDEIKAIYSRFLGDIRGAMAESAKRYLAGSLASSPMDMMSQILTEMGLPDLDMIDDTQKDFVDRRGEKPRAPRKPRAPKAPAVEAPAVPGITPEQQAALDEAFERFKNAPPATWKTFWQTEAKNLTPMVGQVAFEEFQGEAQAAWTAKQADLFQLERERGEVSTTTGTFDIHDPVAVKRVMDAFAVARGGKMDALMEFWKMSILTGPQTHIVNAGSNVLNSAFNLLPRRAAEATINNLLGLVGQGSARAATFGEFAPMAKNLRKGVQLAARMALNSWRMETRTFEAYARAEALQLDFTGVGSEYIPPALGGKIGKVMRSLSFRAMTAADEFQKSLFAQMEAAAQAHRIATVEEKLTGDAYAKRMDQLMTPGSIAWVRAIDEAKRVTFQDEIDGTNPQAIRRLDQLAELAKKGRNMPWLGRPLTFFLPFIDTPLNIFKQAVEMTPIGGFLAVVDMSRALKRRVLSGKLTKAEAAAEAALIYDRARLVRDLTNQTLAWAAFFALQGLASDDEEDELPIITGTVPYKSTRRGERDNAYAVMPPQTIRIGGVQVSYARVEPFATMLASTVDLLVSMKRNGGFQPAVASEWIMRFKDQAKDKTFLQGISNLINAVEDPDRFAERLTANIVTGFVPNLVRQPIREADTTLRDQNPQAADGFFTAVSKRVGFSLVPQMAPARIDVWGREIKTNRGDLVGGTRLTDAAFHILDPLNIQVNPTADPIDRWIYRYNLMTADSKERVAIEPIGNSVSGKVPGEKNGRVFPLTPAEQLEANQNAGQAARAALGDGWESRPLTIETADQIRDIVQKTQRAERERIRNAKLASLPETQ